MLLTFVLGLAAGWGAGYAEPHVKSALSTILTEDDPEMDAVEMRSVSLAVCIFLAALCAWVFASSHVVPLAVGVVLGVLAPRIKEKIRAARAPDYDS